MELTVDLSKTERPAPTPEQDYAELCKIDAKINSLIMDQREAMPAVIHLIDKDLVWPKRLHRQLRRRIGLDDVSGPFYADHYLDNGVRKVYRSDALSVSKSKEFTAYHGTRSSFRTFSLDDSAEGLIFFTDSKTQAKRFGPIVLTCRVTMDSPLYVDGKTLPKYHELEDIEALKEKAWSGRHDGIIIRNFKDHSDTETTAYLVFDPNQVEIV